MGIVYLEETMTRRLLVLLFASVFAMGTVALTMVPADAYASASCGCQDKAPACGCDKKDCGADCKCDKAKKGGCGCDKAKKGGCGCDKAKKACGPDCKCDKCKAKKAK